MLLGGHRGNPDEYPENTLASFASALEIGVDVVECDVHLTADGRLAVIHDYTLDRTTDGTGPVTNHTMDELRAFDAGAGERIPELVEVLDLVRGRAALAIEIKLLPVLYPGIEETVVDALRAAAMVEDCAVISFDHRAVRRVRDLEPRLVCGALLVGRPLDVAGLMARTGAEVYSPQWSFLDQETVAEVHAMGGVVGVWTVDDPLALAVSRAVGVDAIYSNKPREMRAAIGRA
jgi:glycerophosphoryl diester phosphodiesterase